MWCDRCDETRSDLALAHCARSNSIVGVILAVRCANECIASRPAPRTATTAFIARIHHDRDTDAGARHWCNVAIFTVVHAVLIRPLPFPDPDRLVRIAADA